MTEKIYCKPHALLEIWNGKGRAYAFDNWSRLFYAERDKGLDYMIDQFQPLTDEEIRNIKEGADNPTYNLDGSSKKPW